jgi:hypothetical protein
MPLKDSRKEAFLFNGSKDVSVSGYFIADDLFSANFFLKNFRLANADDLLPAASVSAVFSVALFGAHLD